MRFGCTPTFGSGYEFLMPISVKYNMVPTPVPAHYIIIYCVFSFERLNHGYCYTIYLVILKIR